MQLKDLPIGSLVKDLNTKYNGKPLIWKIVAKDQQGYPANSTTLMSNNIISVKYFDNAEPSNTDGTRKTSGNNRWIYSNIRQWLNSNKQVPWFNATHVADASPSTAKNNNIYSEENGFLTNASEDFVKSIMSTNLSTLVPDIDGGGLETTQDSIFLFSMTEMGLAGSLGKEGKIIPYLNTASNRILKPTQEAVDQSNYKHSSLNPNSNYYYWLRSAMPDFSHINFRISTNGSYTQSVANNDTIGVAPALNMASDTLISRQDSDGVYILGFSKSTPVDLSKVQFQLTDKNTNKTITNGSKFTSAIKIDWNADTTDIEFKIELTFKGNKINAGRLQDLSEQGDYVATIIATDKNYPDNVRRSDAISFSIVPSKIDLSKIKFTPMDAFTNNSEITDGRQFTGKVAPTWDEISGITTTVSLSYNGNPKSFSKGNTLVEVGSYTLTYLLTDKNHADNQKSGIVNFSVIAAPVEWDKLGLALRDAITGNSITNGSQFKTEVKPTWTELPTITYGYTLEFAGSLVSYKKGDTLTKLGKYVIKFLLTDKNYPDNTYNEEVSFEVIQDVTDLRLYEMTFTNVYNPEIEEIISEGKVYKGVKVKPFWMQVPKDCKVLSYGLMKDGKQIPFTSNHDVYSDKGQYVITVRLQNGNGEQKDYNRAFKIDEDLTGLDDLIKIINEFDSTEITEGRIFEEQQVLPTWKDPLDLDIYYTLKFEGRPLEFIKGITILSMIGEYSLELTAEEAANPANKKTFTRNFKISHKKVNMSELTITVINQITEIPIENGDIYKIQVKPFWLTTNLPPDIKYESWINYNGNRRTYNKADDEDILKEYGDYVLEVKLIDTNFPTNFKMITRNFKLIPPTIDLSDKVIVIKNKLTDNEITEGQIFRGKDISVQPTWNEYPTLKYSYKLYYNGSQLTNYTKHAILREKGYYRLNVTAFDPNYPDNKVEALVNFSLQDEISGIEIGDEIVDSYLNGLPFELGTPITETGDYNLLVVGKKKTNFKVTISEVNFKIVNPDEDQKPLILINPEIIPSIKDEIEIIYPSYGSEYEYKIDKGEWKTYEEKFFVTDNCTIYARYKDPLHYFVSDSRDVMNIDKLPPDKPIVLGFKEGVDTYFSVSPTVEYVRGVDFTATLNGVPYDLGTPIFNEVPEIRDYTLVVTAKKRLNGLTASTIIKFKLDSIPPDKPKIIGVIPDVIQTDARPDVERIVNVARFLGGTLDDFDNPNSPVYYEARLNGRLFKLGTLVNDPDSYQVSVTAIKKINGLRATSIVAFTILHEIPEPIGPSRLSIIPLIEDNRDKAIDGEMVVDRITSHISLYDDGYLISKTRELEEMLDILDKRIVMIEINLDNNAERVKALKILRRNLQENLNKLIAKNYEVETDINNMTSIITYLDFVDLSIIETLRKELIDIDSVTRNIRVRIDTLNTKLYGKVDLALKIMDGLQNNSSFIGEVIWLKNNQ